MSLTRRNFLSVFSAAALTEVLGGRGLADVGGDSGPLVWSANHDGGTTYIFGFGDAKDRSWFTLKVQKLFDESKEIWFETPKGITSDADKAEDAKLVQELGHDDRRSLFEVLGREMGSRTLKLIQELGVSRAEVEHVRPWLAYYVINGAFWRHAHIDPGDSPDKVLAERAEAEKKLIRTEYPKTQDVTRWFAALSEKAQREHMEDLLDYIDDQKSGRNRQEYGWISGHPDTHTIDRMRLKRPAMYKEFQADRNREWADRIARFDSSKNPYFIVIGLNHVLGPDSLLRCLERIGISVEQA